MVMNELFGVAWIPAAAVLAVGALDIILGQPMYLQFMAWLDDVTDPCGYNNLLHKYLKPQTDLVEEERQWVQDNYKQCVAQLLAEHDFHTVWTVRKLYRTWQIDKLAELMLIVMYDRDMEQAEDSETLY